MVWGQVGPRPERIAARGRKERTMETDVIEQPSNVTDLSDATREVRQFQSTPPRRVLSEDSVDIVDSAEDADYDNLSPIQVTAAMLNQFADEHPELTYPEFDMHLPRTGMKLGKPNLTAKVRIINLADRTILNTLPLDVRRIVQRLFFAGDANTRNKGNVEVRMEKTLDRVRETAHAYGCAGFVEPRLVLHKGDVKDPERESWVGAIDLGDLQEFIRICEGDEQLAARRLEGFSV